MIRQFLLLLLLSISYAHPLRAGFIDSFFASKPAYTPPPTIRVLIIHDRPGVIIETKGQYKLYDPRTNDHLTTRFVGKRNYIQAVTDGLKWGEEFPGVHQLLIVPDNSAVTTIVDGIEYNGSLYIYDVEGMIYVVNQVDIEDYLASSLTSQIRELPSDEVLAAIAIAARTKAYHQVANPPSPYWDVDGRKAMYAGYAVIATSTQVNKAIDVSRYLAMNRSKNEAQMQPFPANWGDGKIGNLSLEQAEQMSKKGDNAAQILSKAFPGSSIVIMHNAAIAVP